MFPKFRPRSAGLIWLTLAALPALRADVTVRYQTKVDLDPNLPPQVLEQMMKGVDAGVPPSSSLQLKNGKVRNESGQLVFLADFLKREITLIDRAGKRDATIPADRYADELTGAMAQMTGQSKSAMAGMHGHAETKATGRTATIQGIEGEEREIDMIIDGPAMANIPAGPMMRMVLHLWTAKAGEAARVPAIGELTRFDMLSFPGGDMVAMTKMFQQMPGFGDAFSTMVKEIKSSGTHVVLRVRVELFLPMLAAMMRQVSGGGDPAGGDSGAPQISLTQEVTEISTAPIADSVFQIPEGYQSAPAADILKDVVKQKMAAAQ